MSTKYVVFREIDDENGGVHHALWQNAEADNAQQACRRIAEKMTDEEIANGVTLIAVPARNWTSGRNTFKAETQRRIRAT